jgi:hypothetical protein
MARREVRLHIFFTSGQLHKSAYLQPCYPSDRKENGARKPVASGSKETIVYINQHRSFYYESNNFVF